MSDDAQDDEGQRRIYKPIGEMPTGETLAAYIAEDGEVGISALVVPEADTVLPSEYLELHGTAPDGTFGAIKKSTMPAEFRAPVERTGPAKVNSRAFRDGWDRIFGRKDDSDEYDA